MRDLACAGREGQVWNLVAMESASSVVGFASRRGDWLGLTNESPLELGRAFLAGSSENSTIRRGFAQKLDVMLILILLILKSCPLLARSDNVFDEDSQYLQAE